MATPGEKVYVRVDRSDTRIVMGSTGTWRCELAGKRIASGQLPGAQHVKFECMVRLSDWECEADDNVVMALFPAPPDLPAHSEGAEQQLEDAQAADNKCIRCNPWPRRPIAPAWESRRLTEFPPPLLLSSSTGGRAAAAHEYSLWGTDGFVDCLLDLLQGSSGNCGVLSAIDAFAHAAPAGGRLRQVFQGCVHRTNGCPEVPADFETLSVLLFNPATGDRRELPCCRAPAAADVPADRSEQAARCRLEVARGTSVPRYARTLSGRCWGMLLEQALACLADGHRRLSECEPGVVWLALCGPAAVVKRYGYVAATQMWQCDIPQVCDPKSLARRSDHLARAQKDAGHAWAMAKGWSDTKSALPLASLEALLEESEEAGRLLNLYPCSKLRASPESGEPCVPLPVCYEAMPSTESNRADVLQEVCKFAVGHCYSVRAARRLGNDGELWLRLRDPRRTRLFWVRWLDILAAGDITTYIYCCEDTSSRQPPAQRLEEFFGERDTFFAEKMPD
eukprot:TRINITY_DN61520_c0_g2_i2.p1 TRINITY_DN61520_c0_g2~~TRINITY_DN61520_c0_g2_i2.p1  ORF type:complete len:507 (+),score=68.28 TRINITY_DN61520_c0_g2_i2:197-1717(+)